MTKNKATLSDYLFFQSLLKGIRREKGLTQVVLAEKMRKPQSYVSKYESGEKRLDLVELRQVCQALEISLIDFVRRFEAKVES
jgi:transcriptional regulator with XRE-family HTH domain